MKAAITNLSKSCAIFLFFLPALFSAAAGQQQSHKDISAVFAEGKISNGQYTNEYFGLTLKPDGAQFVPQGAFISPEGKRARLVYAQRDAATWADKYSVALLADALSANPSIKSPEQYLRIVRHNFEHEGLVTAQEETATKISGVPFIKVVMKTRDSKPHFQAMYSSFLKGYIFSVQIEAPSVERAQQIVDTLITFKTK